MKNRFFEITETSYKHQMQKCSARLLEAHGLDPKSPALNRTAEEATEKLMTMLKAKQEEHDIEICYEIMARMCALQMFESCKPEIDEYISAVRSEIEDYRINH
jgi:hypothetical protein